MVDLGPVGVQPSRVLFTGSRVYGTPRVDSDLDIVMQVTPSELDVIRASVGKPLDALANSNSAEGTRRADFSFRHFLLNFILVTTDRQFDVWERGTRLLQQRANQKGPVTRVLAVELFRRLSGERPGGDVRDQADLEAFAQEVEREQGQAQAEGQDLAPYA